MPRTPDGDPDLQGIWAAATPTPLERTAEFAGKATISDAEALIYERKDHPNFEERADLSAGALARRKASNAVGAEDSETWKTGTSMARVNGWKRTSLVVDPPDGKVPSSLPAAQKLAAQLSAKRDNPERASDLGLAERCLAYSPTPIAPHLYNGNYQFVQTPDYLLLLSEMIHDARIIRTNTTHAPSGVRQWFGDSIGQWGGETLVIDTTNFYSQ